MSRRIGFSLKEVAERLPAYRGGRLSHDDMAEALRGRAREIDAQIARLQAQRQQVLDHVDWMLEQKKQWQARQRGRGAQRKPWPGRPKEKT